MKTMLITIYPGISFIDRDEVKRLYKIKSKIAFGADCLSILGYCSSFFLIIVLQIYLYNAGANEISFWFEESGIVGGILSFFLCPLLYFVDSFYTDAVSDNQGWGFIFSVLFLFVLPLSIIIYSVYWKSKLHKDEFDKISRLRADEFARTYTKQGPVDCKNKLIYVDPYGKVVKCG